VSLLWHPRLDGDLAHRWLASLVREVCAAQPAEGHSAARGAATVQMTPLGA
jgi:hypothetical protein